MYFVKEEEGELVLGTIISDASVKLIGFAEDNNVRMGGWMDACAENRRSFILQTLFMFKLCMYVQRGVVRAPPARRT